MKKESANATGILDKNLAERRQTSAQKWAEMAQGMDDAMRSIGDAFRPVTDKVADGLTGLPSVHTDRHIHPNKTAAESAAKARLAAFNRSTAGVRLEMPGRTDLFAERPIIAHGFKVGLDGEYLVDSVQQVYTQAGWSTTVECNGGKNGKANAKGKKKKKAEKPVKIVSLK
ncbi:hypothetical protein JM49_26300 [Pseudomonas chlororaphis subsp. aurantiaca]|nr:hypothetical protein JM49_26300 [Pseudomonas chlororaphis subsp. aurantiaca]